MAKKQKTYEYAGLKIPAADERRVLFAQFDSSNLQSLAYVIPDNRVVAVFKTSTEKRYEYDNVPAKVFFKVIEADSVGSEFNKRIVKGGYEHRTEKNT